MALATFLTANIKQISLAAALQIVLHVGMFLAKAGVAAIVIWILIKIILWPLMKLVWTSDSPELLFFFFLLVCFKIGLIAAAIFAIFDRRN